MNNASQWRLTMANPIASLYAKNPKVAAVIIGGSTARGHADKYSDIEIGVFWNKPPDEKDRQSVIEQAGGELVYLYPYDVDEQVWSDDYRMGNNQTGEPRSGVSVETVHYTTESMKKTLDAVLREYDPDENKHNLISGVMDGIPIYGNDLLEQWKSQASEYPNELATAVIKRHAQIDHFWRWQMWLHRADNRMLLYQAFSQIQAKLLHILLALNKIYYFGFKWLDVVNERLKVAPEDLLQRMRIVHTAEPADGAQQLAELVEEVYDLIEIHHPEIDVDWLRNVFRYQRPICDEAPNI